MTMDIDQKKEGEKRIIPQSVRQSMRSLKRLIYSNVGMFKKIRGKTVPTMFLTLTFHKNIQDVKFANREFSKFMQRLNFKLFNEKKNKLAYVVVPDFQERGAMHYHCLIFNMPFVKRNVYEFMRKTWGHGSMVNLKALENSWGAYLYLKRYMVKNFEDGRFKGKRKYFPSRNILRPIVIRDDIVIELILRSLDPYLFKKWSGIFYTPFLGDIWWYKYILKYPNTIFDIPLDEYVVEHLKSKQTLR